MTRLALVYACVVIFCFLATLAVAEQVLDIQVLTSEIQHGDWFEFTVTPSEDMTTATNLRYPLE
eukprot:UN08787